MIIYRYTYRLKASIGKAFEYFQDENYFSKYFTNEELRKLSINSNRDTKLQEGDSTTIHVDDDGFNFDLVVRAHRVVENEFLAYNIEFANLQDKTLDREDHEEQAYFSSFMHKYIVTQINYNIQFEERYGQVTVKEMSSIMNVSLLKGLLWKGIGLYYRLKQNKFHKQVAREIEMG